MAKRTVSYGDYQEQEWDEYTGEDPRVGVWLNGKVNRAKYDEDADQMIFYVTVVDHPDFTGWTRGWYAPFEGNQKWKLQEALKALRGGSTADLTLDWENETAVANWLKKAKTIRFQTGEYNERINIRKVRPLLEAVKGTGPKASTPAPAPEPEPTDDEPIEDYTEEELNELTVEELEAVLVEEFDVAEDDLPAKPRRDPKGDKYKAALVEEVLAAQEEGEGDEPAPEAEAPAEGDEEFEDGFEDDADPEPEPEPAKPARRTRATKAAPAPAPAKAAATTRRRRS